MSKYLVIRFDNEHDQIRERVVGRTDDADLAFRLQEVLGTMFPNSDFAVVAKSEYEKIA